MANQIPRPFLLTRVDPLLVKDGRAWAVRQGARWRFAEEVCIQVSMLSILDGMGVPCLSGVGVVRCLERGRLVITA